jgi:hypothetical protein
MMTFDQIASASMDELTDELAAAGLDSTQEYLSEAQEAVIRLLYATSGPFDLVDSETTEVMRKATIEESIESVWAGHEGHISVNGRMCYVAA